VISTTFYLLHVAATCTFQDSSICGYTQDTSDSKKFDWIRGSGATITPNTGPAADHTLGSAAGMFEQGTYDSYMACVANRQQFCH